VCEDGDNNNDNEGNEVQPGVEAEGSQDSPHAHGVAIMNLNSPAAQEILARMRARQAANVSTPGSSSMVTAGNSTGMRLARLRTVLGGRNSPPSSEPKAALQKLAGKNVDLAAITFGESELRACACSVC
jgi:hypothetical protein